MLPQDNILVQAVTILFCLNLVFSYPMTMAPTFQITAAVIFGQNEEERTRETRSRYWKINALRSGLLLFGILASILVAEKLDRVMSLAGVILGMSNVLLVPAICHLKLIATTKLSKLVDIAVICIAIFMLFFGPITIISQW